MNIEEDMGDDRKREVSVSVELLQKVDLRQKWRCEQEMNQKVALLSFLCYHMMMMRDVLFNFQIKFSIKKKNWNSFIMKFSTKKNDKVNKVES